MLARRHAIKLPKAGHTAERVAEGSQDAHGHGRCCGDALPVLSQVAEETRLASTSRRRIFEGFVTA